MCGLWVKLPSSGVYHLAAPRAITFVLQHNCWISYDIIFQVVRVIWHNALSASHSDHLIILARWRQCASLSNAWFIDPTHVLSRMRSWSVHPFLQGLHRPWNTHTHLTALCQGLPGWAGTRKVKPIWILLKQETVSGSGISWAICKSAPHSRPITMPAPTTQFFTGQMPFLPPNQERQSTEGKHTTTVVIGQICVLHVMSPDSVWCTVPTIGHVLPDILMFRRWFSWLATRAIWTRNAMLHLRKPSSLLRRMVSKSCVVSYLHIYSGFNLKAQCIKM